jgi:hypothetical protein
VFIGGMPAARMGDMTEHGGMVMTGSGSVLIGEVIGRNFLSKPDLFENNEENTEPSSNEKIKIIERAIKDCIAALEKKLESLIQNDKSTMVAFTKWFGNVEEGRKQVIEDRIKKQLAFCKKMTLDNFAKIPYPIDYRNMFAYVYPSDESFTIYLGKHFWNKAGKTGKDSNAWTLVHELSHFKNIGRTRDFAYDESCESLALDKPHRALYNADSFAYFIIL